MRVEDEEVREAAEVHNEHQNVGAGKEDKRGAQHSAYRETRCSRIHGADAIKTAVAAQRKSLRKRTYETKIYICLASRAQNEAGPARRPHQPTHRHCVC